MNRCFATTAYALILMGFATGAIGQDKLASPDHFASTVRPLLTRYCTECHSDVVTEADINLAGFESLAHVRNDVKVWVKVRQMLESEQMPPKDSRQPSDQQRAELKTWVRDFLAKEALASAGDPGPVVLRRLSNAEYTYSIRDLTRVAALNPTHEFPVDGAAGEGFTNVGSGQGMSPALLRKYLDSAKSVSGHIVFLPDVLRFSQHTSRRDQTDELLEAIRQFYAQYTVTSDVFVNVDGTGRVANEGGTIPIASYLKATLEEREALQQGKKSVAEIARERSLSGKYLQALWDALSRDTDLGEYASPMMDSLRTKWRSATVDDVDQLTAEIATKQQVLWKFNSIGHIGREGGPKSWLEPVAPPVVTRQELRLKLPDAKSDSADVVFYLIAGDYGDGNAGDFVVWQQPRIEFPAGEGQPAREATLLRDLRGEIARIEGTIGSQTARTAQYLAAAAEVHRTSKSAEAVAADHQLDADVFAKWIAILRLGDSMRPEITGLFTNKMASVAGKDAINGWGIPQTPIMLTNRTNQTLDIGTPIIPARGVTLHPSPEKDAFAAWRSPIDGRFAVEGLVADTDNKCGNGAAWRLEKQSASGTETLASGTIDNGQKQTIKLDQHAAFANGDLLLLVINARDNSHVCDTTHVALNLTEIGGEQRRWDLAADVVDNIHDGNPLPDSHGNRDVWHFGAWDQRGEGTAETREALIPPDSVLAHWRDAVLNSKPADELAIAVQNVLTTNDTAGLMEADAELRRRILQGLEPSWFGRHPVSGIELASEANLCVQAPQVLEVRLPGKLAAGGEFVATAMLHETTGRAGTVQVRVASSKPGTPAEADPVLVHSAGDTGQRMREFQNLFPPAVCYARIVPVDEVVTLTLFHREDEHLKRLLLTEAEGAEIDRLWDELLWVSREPLQLAVAFEQISEFATQDRPDLVTAFEPLRKPINERAEAFRQRMVQAEPSHVAAVLELANRAWRRPLTEAEQDELRDLYQSLRAEEIAHEEAIRLTLARVLTSPSFLYKLEQYVAGTTAAPVTDLELATRLSYFLWSSLPDGELRSVAEAGKLQNTEALRSQTQRMLDDPRTRRLAVEFACQWLHVREFDQNDDKNEKLYPEFASLRQDMHEETVRFFTDMFRRDGSILDMLSADHTFLNEPLARHYGIPGVTGDQWQRVDGIRGSGRGGVLAMATVLASQSGASRTSPILRGNWVYETLLGERLPRPPANVPQLPDEVPQGLSARQLIERHSSDPACAKCHVRIDPYGFSLEQYDAIGRLRPAKVDTQTKLFDGQAIDGIDGLRQYLATERRDDFIKQFCRKLLGYALGREVQLSDEPLLDTMRTALAQNDYRFSVAVEIIVTSDQFRRIRGAEHPTESH